MRTPKFWKDENIVSFCLYPLSLVYRLARTIHVLFSREYKTGLNIICVGNIIAGGSGKTPVSLKIGEVLKSKNINFAYLSKGYKGAFKDFTKVDIYKHTAIEVGDEPLLLAETADTFICKNRKAALDMLSKNYDYDLIVMDDGFQNPTIFKNKNIVVIDGEYGIGNGELLPAGPMRESLKSAIKRATFFIIIGQDKQHIEDKLLDHNIDVVRARIVEKNQPDINKKYIAFCGLGRPEKFFNSLKNSNYEVIKTISFADHHRYKNEEISKLLSEAEKLGAQLITTKKDLVKISDEYKDKIECLNIEIEFYNNDEFKELLLK